MPHAQPLLTFVIPIMHPDNARDWQGIKRYLSQTAESIAAQTNPSWNALVVASRGSDLPALPSNVDIVWVDFPANPKFSPDKDTDIEAWRDYFRLDKGRRVLSAFLHSGLGRYLMIVDGDDLVSNRLVAFVAANDGQHGWRFDKGYVWNDGGSLLYRITDFSSKCGSSHIIRTDLYEIPQSYEAASDAYIKRLLGSHRFIDSHLQAMGKQLAPLSFAGAVYRVSHDSSHSQCAGILRQFFVNRRVLMRPWVLFGRLFRLCLVTARLRREFSIGGKNS